MDNDKTMERWSKTAPSMAGNMIGECVIHLIKRGDTLTIDTLRAELESRIDPETAMTKPIIDAALAIIDQRP